MSTIDKDEGSNADVLYSFKENQEVANRFRINPNTGVVTASSSLASDNGQVFHVEVMATDKGNPPQSSTGLLEIKIGENFDRIPVIRFKNATYHVTVPENLEQHKDVLEVRFNLNIVYTKQNVLIYFSFVLDFSLSKRW